MSAPVFIAGLAELLCSGDVDGTRSVLDSCALKGDALKEALNSAVEDAHPPFLFLAIISGEVDMVQLLVERGADVNFRDSRGWTPLLFALKEAPDSGAICDFLLAKGADPSVASFQKLSPLLTTVYAIEETQPVDGGSAKLAQLEKLLAKGAVDVEAHGYNPFFAACQLQQLASVKLFRQYWTAEQLAAVVNMEIDEPRQGCLSPLMISLSGSGCVEVASLLLELGAKPNRKRAYGYTALYMACCGKPRQELEELVEKMLKDDEIEVDQMASVPRDAGNLRQSALYAATRAGNEKVVQLLLNHKADPMLSDENGMTPLGLCILRNDIGLATVLLNDPRTDVNARDSEKSTALVMTSFLATRNQDRVELTQLLLEKKADPTLKTTGINGQFCFDMNAVEIAQQGVDDGNDISTRLLALFTAAQ